VWEKTEASERAGETEKTVTIKRAVGREKTEAKERADIRKKRKRVKGLSRRSANSPSQKK
jgi:hypothetical protein